MRCADCGENTGTLIDGRCLICHEPDLSAIAGGVEHAAYPAFVKAMKGRDYGAGPLASAWAWFKDGWEAFSDRSVAAAFPTCVPYKVTCPTPCLCKGAVGGCLAKALNDTGRAGEQEPT